MSVHIRQATTQDLPQILQLYAQPAMDNGKVLSLPAAEQHLAHFSFYPNYRLFVACQPSTGALPAPGAHRPSANLSSTREAKRLGLLA